MEFAGVHHVSLNVGDLEQAARFYTEILGLEIQQVVVVADTPRQVPIASFDQCRSADRQNRQRNQQERSRVLGHAVPPTFSHQRHGKVDRRQSRIG